MKLTRRKLFYVTCWGLGMSEINIPSAWYTIPVAELNEYESSTVNPKNFTSELFELYSVPIFPTGYPENIDGRSIGSTKQGVMHDDVLICKINPRINRVWKVRKKTSLRQVASSEWIIVRQKKMDSNFLVKYFFSPQFRDEMQNNLTGVGGSLTRAQPKLVATYSIPIPSIAEQKEIAMRLDDLLGRVDGIKARLESIPKVLKRFRQSVLAAAVSGRLTEEWRENFDSCWTEKKLSEVGDLSRGKSMHRPRNDPRLFGDEYAFVQTGEVANSKGHIRSAKKFYSEFGLAQSKLFPKGTLCITIAANIADTAILEIDACFPDSIVGFKANLKEVSEKYVKLLIDANKSRLEDFAPATAQKNINLKVLRGLLFKFPTTSEQKEIVRRVEQLFAFADQIEARSTEALKRVEKLTPSILAKAFRGDLTAEWREAHPELISGEHSAAALLERIKAEREKLEPKKKGRKKTKV